MTSWRMQGKAGSGHTQTHLELELVRVQQGSERAHVDVDEQRAMMQGARR